jgi:hypothetical protein
MLDLLMQSDALPQQLPGLGAAGLMGAMWLWERKTSQKREQQIDESHARIVADRVQLDTLAELVRANTQALTRLATLLEPYARPAKERSDA